MTDPITDIKNIPLDSNKQRGVKYLVYERKPNGSYGAITGRHDDLLMTRAIGLHICFHEMDTPRLVPRQQSRPSHRVRPVSEAVF